MKTQEINLKESQTKAIINYDSKQNCEECKKPILKGIVDLELVGLAEWDLHKCKVKK